MSVRRIMWGSTVRLAPCRIAALLPRMFVHHLPPVRPLSRAGSFVKTALKVHSTMISANWKQEVSVMEHFYPFPRSPSALNSISNLSLRPYKNLGYCCTMADITASMILSRCPLRMKELNLCFLPGVTPKRQQR